MKAFQTKFKINNQEKEEKNIWEVKVPKCDIEVSKVPSIFEMS